MKQFPDPIHKRYLELLDLRVEGRTNMSRAMLRDKAREENNRGDNHGRTPQREVGT